MKKSSMQSRWEQHVASGGKLTLEQFELRAKRLSSGRSSRGGISQAKRHFLDCPKDVRRDIAMDVLDDLPDGAFFAAASSDFGLDAEDFID